MTTPQIYDSQGERLEVGDRVETVESERPRFVPGVKHWYLAGIKWIPGWRKGWAYGVSYGKPDPGTDLWFFLEPAEQPNTYRCPDLTRIHPEEEGRQ